jgi:DNA-binding IscR family transcriptional regulator
MVTVEDYILGSGALHDRFFATTEILAKLVASAPRTVGIAQLEEATGRPAKELTKLCNSLVRANLLRHDPFAADKWMLTCDPSLVTLEDVFRCVMNEQHARSRSGKTVAERAPNDVDLLVMQAMIAVNQSVFKHLRQFSLDRLKVSAAGMFPVPRRTLSNACLGDTFDLAMSGSDNSFSPMQIPA